MKLTNDYEHHERGITAAQTILLFATLIILIFLAVFYVNRDSLKLLNKKKVMSQETTEEDGKDAEVKHETSEEVWEKVTADPSEYQTDSEDTTKDTDEDGEENTNPSQEENMEEYEKTHVLVTCADGTQEWLPISTYLDRNTYDADSFITDTDFYSYSIDGEIKSYLGISVDKQQGIIDYNKVKKTGIDFVMVKLGQRGYQTGTLSLDEYFSRNMLGASNAGLYIGVIFESQAVTIEEAEEEADMVIQYLADYTISYPVVFHMKYAEDDIARADSIGKFTRSEIARTFLDKIKNEGYIPMLYGDKEWLLKKYEVSILEEYDIWLEEYDDVPDYPYLYAIWGYNNSVSINGVSKSTGICLSFRDFSVK